LATEDTGDTKRVAYVGTGKTDYDVGWTAGGHFGNYTRHYPAGAYNVYMRASQPNVALQSDAASVTVASGTAAFNGSGPYQFSIPNTGGWQNFTYVPLIDSSVGTPAQIVFDGTKSTLTVTVDGGNLNENFFFLIPAETNIPVSSITFPSTYPDGTAMYQATNTFAFEVTSPSAISPVNITVIVTGTNLWGQGSVTNLSANQGLTLTDMSGGQSTDFIGKFALASNSIYSVYIQGFDSAGVPATTTVKFDTIAPNSYTFEAEDYNYTDQNSGNAGLFFDNPQTNAYMYMAATEGIDDHVVSTGGNNAYGRISYPAGSTPACLSIENACPLRIAAMWLAPPITAPDSRIMTLAMRPRATGQTTRAPSPRAPSTSTCAPPMPMAPIQTAPACTKCSAIPRNPTKRQQRSAPSLSPAPAAGRPINGCLSWTSSESSLE
jgi:hypothetical protein